MYHGYDSSCNIRALYLKDTLYLKAPTSTYIFSAKTSTYFLPFIQDHQLFMFFRNAFFWTGLDQL